MSNLKIDTLLNHIRLGKKPISLVKQLNISPQLLHYYLKGLKDKGIIRKLTKGVWEIVKDNLELNSKVKSIRAHGFIWIIKLPMEIKHWEDRAEILKKNNIDFLRKGNTIRILIKGKKVWLNNKSIIIYEPKSFYATLPLETRKLAVYELLETIKSIENTIGINLHGFGFKTKREHYALVKNDIAIQVNKDGEKLYLTDNGEWWGVIDKSHNGDEFEFFKTKSYSGLVNSNGALGYYNEHKDTNWQVTPKFTLEVINTLTNDVNKLVNAVAQTGTQLLEYRKENKEHLKLIKLYVKEAELRIKKNTRNLDLKQKSIFDY
jgi:hypothetical protein